MTGWFGSENRNQVSGEVWEQPPSNQTMRFKAGNLIVCLYQIANFENDRIRSYSYSWEEGEELVDRLLK